MGNYTPWDLSQSLVQMPGTQTNSYMQPFQKGMDTNNWANFATDGLAGSQGLLGGPTKMNAKLNEGTAGLFTDSSGNFSGSNALGTIGSIAGLAQGLFGEGGLFGGSRQLDAMEKGLDAQIAANKRGFNAMATQQRNNVARYNGYNGNKKNDKEVVKNV